MPPRLESFMLDSLPQIDEVCDLSLEVLVVERFKLLVFPNVFIYLGYVSGPFDFEKLLW
jgi:hypothetical protein